MKTYYSTNDIERDHNGFFFTKDSMRFFRSKVLETVYQGPGGVYFVTSEQFRQSTGPAWPRRYTVRRFNPETKTIETASEFNVLTKSRAQKLAQSMADTAKGDLNANA